MSSNHREKTAVNFEEVKPKSETDTTRDSATKADLDINKKTVLDTNTEKSGHDMEQSNRAGEKGTKTTETERLIVHRVTQSFQDTVTITKSEATEAQVCLMPAMVDCKMML